MIQQPKDKKMPEKRPKVLPGWKRALDVAFSLLAMPVLAACTLLMATISPGPVIFRQQRVGYRGRRFMCFKFRTMRVEGGSRSHQPHPEQLIRSAAPMTEPNDWDKSRLVPCGSVIRASGLAGLPQVLNILRGEMSLVGPRPCLPHEFERDLPWQQVRFNTLPGLTGPWRVFGNDRTTFDEMVRLDLRYSENPTFWLDLKIIAMTIPALLQQFRRAGTGQAGRAQTGRSERLNVGP